MNHYEEMFEFHSKELSYSEIESAVSDHFGLGSATSSFFGESLRKTKPGEQGNARIQIAFDQGAFFDGYATYYWNPQQQDYVVMMSSIVLKRPKK
jgi:hypothetical protein